MSQTRLESKRSIGLEIISKKFNQFIGCTIKCEIHLHISWFIILSWQTVFKNINNANLLFTCDTRHHHLNAVYEREGGGRVYGGFFEKKNPWLRNQIMNIHVDVILIDKIQFTYHCKKYIYTVKTVFAATRNQRTLLTSGQFYFPRTSFLMYCILL